MYYNKYFPTIKERSVRRWIGDFVIYVFVCLYTLTIGENGVRFKGSKRENFMLFN